MLLRIKMKMMQLSQQMMKRTLKLLSQSSSLKRVRQEVAQSKSK